MKGKHAIPTLLILLFAGAAAFAQRPALEGEVLLHNSRQRTGQLSYVEGALVSAPFTTTQSTNRKGRFKLEFAGADGGNFIVVNVEKPGLSAVNFLDLQGIAIGREAPLQIFLAEESQIEQARADLLRAAERALNSRYETLAAGLRRGGAEGQAARAGLEKQFNREFAGYAEAEQALRQQREELKWRLPEMAEKLARVNLDFASAPFQRAYEHFLRGEMEEAAAALGGPELEKGAEMARLALQELDNRGKTKQAFEARESVQQFAGNYWLQGLARLLLFEYQEALEAHRKAAFLLEKAGEEKQLALSEAYGDVALGYLLTGEHNNALYYQQMNVKIKERLLESGTAAMAPAWSLLAEACRNLEEYQLALEAQQKALAIQRQSLAPGHPSFAASHAGLAAIYRGMGEYGMALEAQQELVSIQEQALPPNHPDIARSYEGLAAIFLEEGAYLKALEAQLQAIFILERALAPGHPDIVRSYDGLALAYLKLGDYQEALQIRRKAISIQERALPAGHPGIAASYHEMASTFYFLSRLDSALAYEHKAYDILKAQLPAGDAQLQTLESSFAFLYTTRGERRQAAGLHEAAVEDLRKALEFRPDSEEAKRRIRQMEAGQGSQKKNTHEAVAVNRKGTAGDRASNPGSPERKTAAPGTSLGFFRLTQATSFREGPGSSAKVLKRLAAGDQVEVVEKTSYYWWKAVDNGRVGYVKALLLEAAR